MTTPDGWQVELVRFGADPRFRVTCAAPGGPGRGVIVSLAELVSVLGDSFDLLGPELVAAAQGPRVAVPV